MALRVVSGFSLLAIAAAGWAQSFTLSVAPGTVTIHPGDQNIPVTVTVGSSTYPGPITITLTGLPSGISVSPLTLTAGSSGTLNLSASLSADQEAFPASNPSNPNSISNPVNVVGVAGSTLVSSAMTLIVSLSNPSYAPNPSQINLPIVTINTNGTPIVSKTTDVPGTITITSADGQTSYLPNASDTDNTATFHVHGNSTALMPKLPYTVKLNTSLDLLNTMGLSCPYVTDTSAKPACDKSKSYVLLANYDDKTLLRDWSASALANAIPIGNGYLNSPADSPSPSGTSVLMPWAPHSLFVELYLNGVYEGNYQLIEEVKVDSHRVNITELTDTDTTDVTGGYLLQIDHEDKEATMFDTPQGVPIGLVDPDFAPTVPQQTAYITSYVDAAEDALFGHDYTGPTGWRAYFDEASAVNFYIVNDVMGNVDGGDFYSSDYLYKNIDNPLLYMGPVWDFDISSGNVNYSWATILNPTVPWMQTASPWYMQWFTDPLFKADVATQWNTLKNNGVFTQWLASINQEAATLQQSQANNFGRWPMQGIMVWPNAEAAGSYNGEVAYLTNWLNLRIAYLDSVFNSKAQTYTALTVPAGTLRQGSPVTLSAGVTGGSAPTGSVFFLWGWTVLGEGALDGNGQASLTTTNLPAGTYNLQAIYSGDDNNGLSASYSTSVTVLGPLLGTATALTSSVTEVNPETPASFTVMVLGNSGTVTPTGTVSFTANGQPLGAAPLSGSGTATFSPTQLPSGSDSIQAVYSGDSTYQISSSNPVTVAVAPLPIPVFSLASGTYITPQTVTLTDATPGAAIYYTIDGTTPTTASTPYGGPITVSSTETLEAISAIANYPSSAIATASYTIAPLAATPVFSLASGNYTTPQTVTLTDATPGAAIYYTSDGTTPTTASTPYSGPIAVSSAETLEAIALATGYTTSAVASAAYTIGVPGFTLGISPTEATLPPGGSVSFSLTVTPQNGFNQEVSFACSGLAPGAVCGFAPATAAPDGAPLTSTLTLTQANQGAGIDLRLLLWTKIAGGMALGLLLWPVRRRRAWFLVAWMFLLATGFAVMGCQSMLPPPYVVTVTAAGGNTSQSAKVTITETNTETN